LKKEYGKITVFCIKQVSENLRAGELKRVLDTPKERHRDSDVLHSNTYYHQEDKEIMGVEELSALEVEAKSKKEALLTLKLERKRYQAGQSLECSCSCIPS